MENLIQINLLAECQLIRNDKISELDIYIGILAGEEKDREKLNQLRRASAGGIANQTGHNVNNNVGKNDYNNTDDGIKSGTFSFFCCFFIAGRSDVPKATNYKE